MAHLFEGEQGTATLGFMYPTDPTLWALKFHTTCCPNCQTICATLLTLGTKLLPVPLLRFHPIPRFLCVLPFHSIPFARTSMHWLNCLLLYTTASPANNGVSPLRHSYIHPQPLVILLVHANITPGDAPPGHSQQSRLSLLPIQFQARSLCVSSSRSAQHSPTRCKTQRRR